MVASQQDDGRDCDAETRSFRSGAEHRDEKRGSTGSNPVQPTKFWTYIIQNPTGGFYVGHTENLEQRVTFHNTGQSHYTARKGPWKIVYSEEFPTRSEATKRESEIKRWKSAVKIRELIGSSEL